MASKSSRKTYNLQDAREDVRRLLVSQRRIPYDEFGFVFQMQYGHDLCPENFGYRNLQQLFEKSMIDLVKIGGATHRDRIVMIQRGAALSQNPPNQMDRAAAGSRTPAVQANRTGPGGGASGVTKSASTKSAPTTSWSAYPAQTTARSPLSSDRQGARPGQPAYVRSFVVHQQRPIPMGPPVRNSPRSQGRPRAPGGIAVQPMRYPQAVFVAPPLQYSTQSQRVTGVNTGAGRRSDSTRLIKTLEARAKDFARDCIADGKHVDSSRICQAILRERNVDNFKVLGLRGHYDIPYIKELEQLQRRIYETVTAYCQVRATSTLFELGMYLAQLEEKESFEDLGLGPLLEQPSVFQYFKPRRTLRGVPEITTKDVLEYLRTYMTKYDKWYGRIEMTDFMKFVARERGCADPFELCVRVPSIGLSISVLRKAQRREKEEWRRIRDDIARETTDHIERRLRAAIEHLLGNTGRQLKPTEKARIDEIAGQPAEEVVQHVFVYLSHRDMFPTEVNEAMRRFFNYVSTNQFASKLFKLAICKGTIEDSDQVEDLQYLEEEEEEECEGDEATEDEEDAENQEYDSEWDRRHHRQGLVVPEGDVVSQICQWLEQADDLDLRILAQIEAKVATRFAAPEFTDLGHNSFLHLVTHSDPILYILENSSLHLGRFSDNDKEHSSNIPLTQIPREHVLDFLQQCGLGRIHVSLSQALCDQFGVVQVEDLRVGSVEKLIQRAYTHQANVTVTPDVSQSFPRIAYQSALLCGSTQIEANVSRAAIASPGGSGLLGWQSLDRAVQCLLSCPELDDLFKWSHWGDVFAPSHGPLKEFIIRAVVSTSSGKGLFALETEPGVYLRVNPHCSLEAFTEATARGDVVTAAGQIVSLIIQNGNIAAFPLALVANHTRTALERLSATVDLTKSDNENSSQQPCFIPEEGISDFQRHPAVQFVLDMFLRIPYKLSIAISREVLLEPLHHIVGGIFAPKMLLRYCTSDREKTALQKLGIALGITEWVQDFEKRVNPPVISVPAKVTLHTTEVKFAGDDEREGEAETDASSSEETELEGVVGDSERTETDQMEVDDHTEREDTFLTSPESQDLDESEDSEQRTTAPSVDSDSAIETSVDDDLPESSVDTDNGKENSDEHDMTAVPEENALCKAVIDNILREEFGEGLELGPEEERLVQKQRLREGRGLHRLSSELYSKDTHFVLELVQNADDNSYPSDSDGYEFLPAVEFVVTKDCVTVLNNERGFEEKHIRALCDVGKSTKGKHTKGYIGQKGIGFKSVFRVTDIPEVHSNGYHIKFNAKSGPLGYIFPHWISPLERELYDGVLEGIDGADDERWTTKIVLPLKDDLRGQLKSLAPRFHDVQPSLLLFLNRLRRIVIVDKVNKTERYMQRRDLPNGLVEVEHSLGVEKWLVVRRELDAKRMKEGVGHTEVAIGFPLPIEDVLSLASPLQQNLPQQKVFAYLPLQSYGLRFIIQADFEVPSSREAVDESSPWNQWLRSQIPSLFVEEGLKRFKELPDTLALEALCIFLRFVPLETEVQGFFQPVTRQIVQLLKASNCMPAVTKNTTPQSQLAEHEDEDDIEWVQPSQVVIAKDNLVYEVLPVLMLKDHLDLHYLHSKVTAVLNPGLARYLGVEELSTSHLLRIAETMCAMHVNQIQLSANGLSLPWVAKWLVCLSRAMIREFNTSGSLNESLKKLAIVPLSNGNFVSLADKIVFFPIDDKLKKPRSSQGPTYLDAIHDDMNTVSKDLLTIQSNADNAAVYKLLEEMGVKRMSPREILHSHIIPTLKTDEWLGKSPGLVASFLVFAKIQLDYDPNIVKLETLRSCAVLLTDQGRLRPTEDIIHFSSIYLQDRRLDLQRLFPEVKWRVIDQLYLQLYGVSNPAHIQSWEMFLQKLGVESCLAIRERTVALTQDELGQSHWVSLAKSWPQSPDGQYKIFDYTCPEFLAVVGSVSSLQVSVQKERMKSLIDLFNHYWDMTYNGTTKAKVVDGGSNNEICETESTFYMEMKRTAWIPAIEKYHQGTEAKVAGLYRPEKLFLNEKKAKQLLHCHVRYADATITNWNFIKCLGLVTPDIITEEFMLDKMKGWSGLSAKTPAAVHKHFTTSLAHMSSVYHYLLGLSQVGDRQDQIRGFFHQERAFFVPNCMVDSRRKAHDLVTGSFFTFEEVCWEDKTRVLSNILGSAGESMVPGPKLLCEVYVCLGDNECRSLWKLFQDKLDLQKTPTITGLLDVMEYIAGRERIPRISALQQIQSLYIAVNDKVRKAAEEEAYTTARNENPSLPTTLAKFQSENPGKTVEELLLDEGVELNICESKEAHSVRSYIANKVLFASLKQEWVSIDHRPMINDHQQVGTMIAHLPRVHFVKVHLETQHEDVSSAVLGPEARKSRRLKSQREEKEKDEIHQFFAVCGIRKLSQAIREEVHEDGVCGCPELQRKVRSLLPFVQQYMFSEIGLEYHQLIVDGVADGLRELRFSIADRLSVSLTVEGLDVHTDEQEQDCALINREALVVSRQAWTRAEKHCSFISGELAKFFLPSNHAEYFTLASFIQQVAELLRDRGSLNDFIDKRGLCKLPGDEVVWIIPKPNQGPESSVIEVIPQQQQQKVPRAVEETPDHSAVETVQAKKSQDSEMRSWPPRSSMQARSSRQVNDSRKNDKGEMKHEWSLPQRPEQWKGPDGQLPPSKETVPPDQRNSHLTSDKDAAPSHGDSTTLFHVNTTHPNADLSADSQSFTPASFQQIPPQIDPQLGNPLQYGDMQHQFPMHGASPQFQLPFLPGPVASIPLEEIATAAQLRPPTSVIIHDHSTLLDVGRYGEELVFLYLLKQQELGLLIHDSQSAQNVTVLWVNQSAESGLPFDIQINFHISGQQAPKSLFIEVKTTKTPDKGLFEISNNELRFAHQQRDAFHLYRVFNAGSAAVRMLRLKNLSQYLDANQVRLYIEM